MFERKELKMPVCKAEAHRALELLEDYYSRLDDSDEKELKAAIERVIKIFKSRLFQVRETFIFIFESNRYQARAFLWFLDCAKTLSSILYCKLF